MGPTQSSVAWPGCAQEKQNYQEGLQNKDFQKGFSDKRDVDKGVLDKDDDKGLFARSDAGRQSVIVQRETRAEQHGSKHSHCVHEDDQESHHVSVNPVYEFALCRKIKETFRKGETGERSSPAAVEDTAPSECGTDNCAATVVSVQPQSLASGNDHQSTTDLTGTDTRLDSGQSVTTKSAESCSESTPDSSEQKPEMHRAVFLETRTETHTQPPEEKEMAGVVPQTVPAQSLTHPPVHTGTRATQTTLTHPGDISLSPPPPRPVMISVSTPPDETSPMLCSFSPPTGSPVDDVPSSPDLDSEVWHVRHAHLRGCLAPDSPDGGAAAAGAAAAGTPDSSPGVAGRRKRSKKKEDKSIDYVLRALNSLGSPEEKLTAMCRRYTELHEEQKGLQNLLRQHQRHIAMVQREKDQLQQEHNRAVMSKSKLESLCRELQKQNKLVKDESLCRLKEEEDRRKQMSAKFQTSLSEIQAQVQQNQEQNLQLRADNAELSGRLQTFLTQHKERQQQLDQLSQHRDLELQVAEARLQQASAILMEEQEIHVLEKEKILLQATKGEKMNAILEEELNTYKSRYDEFQDTISKSSQAFHRLKADMDKMGTRMKKLEKDGQHWKHKWETSQKTLHDLKEEKASSEREGQRLQTKVIKLESLCRALQSQLREARTSEQSAQSSEASCEPLSTFSADDCVPASSSATTTTVSTGTTTTPTSSLTTTGPPEQASGP